MAAKGSAPTPTNELGRHLMAAGILAGCLWMMGQAMVFGLGGFLGPDLRLRLAPHSTAAMLSAAEDLQARGENAKAAELARKSIAQAPFDPRALRILGFAVADQNPALANQVLTLAGNWSLRDDRTHAWLLERRLKDGDFPGALAHADLLLRRRGEYYAPVFPLLDAFAVDPVSAVFVAKPLEAKPNWRAAYLSHLVGDPARLGAAQTLAFAMGATAAPMDAAERAGIYGGLAAASRYADLKTFRRSLGEAALGLQDGAFPTERQPPPMGWLLGEGAGLDVQIVDVDVGEAGRGSVIELRHDGFTPGVAARQLLLLEVGRWIFRGEARWASPVSIASPKWTLTCVGGGVQMTPLSIVPEATPVGEWFRFEAVFTVPENCIAQNLDLVAPAGERRADVDVAFDNLSVQRQ